MDLRIRSGEFAQELRCEYDTLQSSMSSVTPGNVGLRCEYDTLQSSLRGRDIRDRNDRGPASNWNSTLT